MKTLVVLPIRFLLKSCYNRMKIKNKWEKQTSWHANFHLKKLVISVSWLTSCWVKQQLLSVFFATGKITKSSETLRKVRHKWTGWSKSKNVVSLSSAATTAQWDNHPYQALSTHQDTWTSQSKYSVLFVYWMVRLPFLTHNQVLRPQTETVWRQRNYGVPRIVFANKMGKMVLTSFTL